MSHNGNSEYMNSNRPDYIFETSWEVCNKVGGIYTVLSTRAKTLTEHYKNNLIFVGPDIEVIYPEAQNTCFLPEKMEEKWLATLLKETGLEVRMGHWDIPGSPKVILINFTPIYAQKNEIYSRMWEKFQVNSMAAYGDYDEGCMFSYSAGLVIQHYYNFHKLHSKKVVAHFNEWTTGFGLLYLKAYEPSIATVFTTHATSIGRSIAGNNKPLYDEMRHYNGNQMAEELNMVSKHSIERSAAHHADCFTTVSDVTNIECEYLLDKPADIVTPNGFEPSFVPQGEAYTTQRTKARASLCKVAENLFGYKLPQDTVFLGTSGRYEYKNKGLDLLIDAFNILNNNGLKKNVVAFLMVPAWISGPRLDLDLRMQTGEISNRTLSNLKTDTPAPLQDNYITHLLVEPFNDNISNALKWFNLTNQQGAKMKVIFVPTYLNGQDGIFNLSYYDLLAGFDLTVFPSYYEPWGYTPLESVAFGIPTLTSNLSGFGQWVSDDTQSILDGVGIIKRTDANYHKAATELAEQILTFVNSSYDEKQFAREQALEIASKANWDNFIDYYYIAYNIALTKVAK